MFTIGIFDVMQMTFLSRFIVVVIMFLMPMRKVCMSRFERFERKMTVTELLNVIKFLIQTIWAECFQFQNPKIYLLF